MFPPEVRGLRSQAARLPRVSADRPSPESVATDTSGASGPSPNRRTTIDSRPSGRLASAAMIDVLKSSDPEVFELCRAEERRQAENIRLTPSENSVSKAVLEASSSV